MRAMSVLLLCAACHGTPPRDPIAEWEAVPVPGIPWTPRVQPCLRAGGPLVLDGRLDESAWQGAPWSEPFADISGPGHPEPTWSTRMKMLWDDEALYVGAELTEPHVWATLTERDSVIYFDNDFEVFLDPDGDTHQYYELEVNALATEWDLFLVRPYRDGGPALHAWDIPGLCTAVHVDGTLNDPSDEDRGWSVEIAIPWEALAEATSAAVPPEPGDAWWANFSRVEWDVEVVDGAYRKVVDPATGRPRPEHNWVWTPTGLINIHYPEQWGLVFFLAAPAADGWSGDLDLRGPASAFVHASARTYLREVYYAQRAWFAEHGRFAGDLADLGLERRFGVELFVTPNGFEARQTRSAGGEYLGIREDGRVWSLEPRERNR